ncbi:protein kinase [Saccharothrix sp. AJ9571]|nr:protein kinase [Saccharothrix sp. AJ9571]
METIGEGPVAVVYADGDSALKAFPEPLTRQTRANLDHELATLRTLDGARPILVPDGVEELPDGRPALRMERCAQSLAQLVEHNGPLSAEDTITIGLTLSAALATAHEAGVVHGGVHPANLLFRDTGELLIADFGVVLRAAFPRDVLPGLEFTAPETVLDGTVDEAADLYGLGAVLQFALTGEPPFRFIPGEQSGERVIKVLHSPPAPVEDERLGALIGHLLAKQPEDRPDNAAAVTEELSWLRAPDLPRTPVKMIKPVAVKRRAPEDRQNKLGLILGIAAALALLAAAPILLLSQRSADPPAAASGGAAVPLAPLVPTPPKPLELTLAEPEDLGDTVRLTWTSPEVLDFVVVVAPAGQRNNSIYVERKRTFDVTVSPGLQYCFAVQGTNGAQTIETPPKPIRGATCTP